MTKRKGKEIDEIIALAKIQNQSPRRKQTGYERGDKLYQSNAASRGELNPLCGIKFEKLDFKAFQKICPWDNHQGVAGIISNKELVSVEDLINISLKKGSNPTLVILDHIEDPRNLGSIIRSAEVLGIGGIIIPKDRAADLTPVVSKCSSGALEYMPISRVSNVMNTIRLLKEKGFWLIGAKEMAGTNRGVFLHTCDFKKPVALVLGGEKKGIRPLIEKKCDEVVSIRQLGHISSLNVSCAAAILFYEILKQKSESEV